MVQNPITNICLLRLAVDSRAIAGLFNPSLSCSLLHDLTPTSKPALGIWRWIVMRMIFRYGTIQLATSEFSASYQTCREAAGTDLAVKMR